MGSRKLHLGVILLTLSSTALSQGTGRPTPKNGQAPSQSCESRIKAARSNGVTEGAAEATAACTSLTETAKAEGYSEGWAALNNVLVRDLGKTDGKIPIKLLIEEIPGADSYRLAAAELINTFYAQKYEIAPDATLILYVTGAGGGPDTSTFSYEVSLFFNGSVPIKSGEKMTLASGELVLAEKGGYLQNYPEDRRTQAVKEAIYSVLSEGDSKLFSDAK